MFGWLKKKKKKVQHPRITIELVEDTAQIICDWPIYETMEEKGNMAMSFAAMLNFVINAPDRMSPLIQRAIGVAAHIKNDEKIGDFIAGRFHSMSRHYSKSDDPIIEPDQVFTRGEE